jgi:hypothetical protein
MEANMSFFAVRGKESTSPVIVHEDSGAAEHCPCGQALFPVMPSFCR